MKLFSGLYEDCKKHPLWVFGFGGLVLWGCGFLLEYFEEILWLSKILMSIGALLISGGVFAVIVKSAQFSEIFEDTLRKIIYQKEHLAIREDLEDIWKTVTLAYSKQKFPAISDAVNENIKKYFLPIQHDYYYDNTRLTIDMEIDPEDNEYVIVTEKHKIYIIVDDADQPICYKFSNAILFDNKNLEKTNYTLQSLKINGKAYDNSILTTANENQYFVIKAEVPLSGSVKYTIEREDVKKYKFSLNLNKMHLAIWLYNNFSLTLTYPNELYAEFNGLGVLQNWKVDNNTKNTKFNRLEASYSGLIYKNQGFIVHFNKINI